MQIAACVAVITGGASGLGAATVQLLAAAGARVVILDVNTEAGTRLAATYGDQGWFVKTDVTSAADTEVALQQARDKFGALHILISCAGIGTAGRVVSKQGPLPLEVFECVIRINLVRTFNLIRLAAVHMQNNVPNPAGERGVIINTASIAAFDGQIGQAAYAASKAGIVGLTLPVARELAPLGIRVMTIAPGIFDTPMLAGLPDPARHALSAAVPSLIVSGSRKNSRRLCGISLRIPCSMARPFVLMTPYAWHPAKQ
jgi:NAD(P)-dependent dehydrogenase (short-subunit alcohol dehydrogenase family)